VLLTNSSAAYASVAAVFIASCHRQTLSDEEEGDFQVVHAGAGSPADLPGPVQGLLAALRHNQAALDTLAAQRQQQRDAVDAQEDKLRLELAGKRR
jgi:hypothetical protein